jgi:hypothetical protein
VIATPARTNSIPRPADRPQIEPRRWSVRATAASLRRVETLQELIERQCGALTVRQAKDHLTPAAVRWRVAAGRWQRLGRGLLVAHSGPAPPRTRLWLAVLAGGPDAVLAGPTAAALAGLRGYESRRIHLLVAPGRQVTSIAGLVVHRSGRLAAEDLHRAASPPRTAVARSVVDTACWSAHERAACAVVAAAVQQRLVPPARLRDVLERLPTARHRRVLLQTLADVDGGAHSIAELDLVRLCRRAGLPAPARQVARTDATGRRRWLDAYWPDWRLQVEVDGAAHTEVTAWWADMRRQNDAWIRGDRVLRFPAVLLRSEPATVLAQLRAAFEAAGWPGSCEQVS